MSTLTEPPTTAAAPPEARSGLGRYVTLWEIYRLRRDEFAVALATAIVVVGVGVEQGIILAIVLSVILHVKRHYAPNDLVVSWDSDGRIETNPPAPGALSEPGLVVYRFGVGLFYANAERFSEEVLELVDTAEQPRWFVLDAEAMDDVDYTGGKTLAEVADQLVSRGIVFAVAQPNPKLRHELTRFGVTEKIGTDRLYDSLDEARSAFNAESPRRP